MTIEAWRVERLLLAMCPAGDVEDMSAPSELIRWGSAPDSGVFFANKKDYGEGPYSSVCASPRFMPETPMASVAAIRPSRSPSRTPDVSEVSNPVRRSLTIW